MTPSSAARGSISDGCLVRLKNGPPCGPNAVVFNQSGPKPRVGKTVNNLDNDGLNPKNSVLVKVFKDFSQQLSTNGNAELVSGRGKSKFLKDIEQQDKSYEGLEVWSLSDVVFLDDSPAVLGRVVTVDQLQAIVDISHASSDAGTMESLSTAQSTLKVYKLTDIESCMDKSHPFSLGAKCHALKGEGRRAGEGGGLAVSQHIAGVVQHRPACLLTPSPGPHLPPDSTQGHTPPPCTCVYGHYPLAIHSTDNGPIMLVKRVSDGTAFLVCSGHSGFPAFSSSSFVSLNSRDGKPGRCTIDEESVPACDGGLDRASWMPPSSKNTGIHGGSPNAGNQETNGSPMLMEGSEVNTSRSKSDGCPSFVQFHKSDAIMLRDSNGIMCSLSDGLRLRPSPLPNQHTAGRGTHPLQPYKCIVTRNQVVKKDLSVLIVVVGKSRNL